MSTSTSLSTPSAITPFPFHPWKSRNPTNCSFVILRRSTPPFFPATPRIIIGFPSLLIAGFSPRRKDGDNKWSRPRVPVFTLGYYWVGRGTNERMDSLFIASLVGNARIVPVKLIVRESVDECWSDWWFSMFGRVTRKNIDTFFGVFALTRSDRLQLCVPNSLSEVFFVLVYVYLLKVDLDIQRIKKFITQSKNQNKFWKNDCWLCAKTCTRLEIISPTLCICLIFLKTKIFNTES